VVSQKLLVVSFFEELELSQVLRQETVTRANCRLKYVTLHLGLFGAASPKCCRFVATTITTTSN
jgi:hypothetical protein